MEPISGTTPGSLQATSLTSSEEYTELKDVELGEVPGPDRLERMGVWAMVVVAILVVVGIVMLAVFWNK